MSWIKDVKEEIKALEISKKSLRNFGLLVGGIFFLLGLWIYYRLRVLWELSSLLSVRFSYYSVYYLRIPCHKFIRFGWD